MKRIISVEGLLSERDLLPYRLSESDLEKQCLGLESIAEGLISLTEGNGDSPIAAALESLFPTKISTEAPVAVIAALFAAVVATIAWVLKKFFSNGSSDLESTKKELKETSPEILEASEALTKDREFTDYTPTDKEVSMEDQVRHSAKEIKLRLVKDMHESKLLHTFDMFESPVKAADELRKLADNVVDYVELIVKATSKLKSFKHREGGLPPQKDAREIADTIDAGSKPLFSFYNQLLGTSGQSDSGAKELSDRMKAAASDALKSRQINVSTISNHVNSYVRELHHIVDSIAGSLEALSSLKGPIKQIGDVLSGITVRDRVDHPEIIAMAAAIKYGFHTCQFSMSHIEQRVQEMIRLNKLISKYLK